MNSRRVAFLTAVVAMLVAACGSAGPSQPPSAGVGSAQASGADRSPTPAASPGRSPVARTPLPPFEVTGVDLRSNPASSIGTCPLEITFSATISAIGTGEVSYRWHSSDGDVSPIKTISVSHTAPATITSSWTVDARSVPTHAGWSTIELIDPSSAAPDAWPTAKPATFTFTCPTDDDIEAIGFGLGGSDKDCSIATHLETFNSDDPIRVVADYRPSLIAGTTVTFSLSRDDVVVRGYPVQVTLDVSTRCVHGSVSPGNLPAGHYRLDIQPDTARAISGEFDVR